MIHRLDLMILDVFSNLSDSGIWGCRLWMLRSIRRMLRDDVLGEAAAVKPRAWICCLSLPRAQSFGSGTAISKYVQGMGVEGNLPISRAGQTATSSAFSGPKRSLPAAAFSPFIACPCSAVRPAPGTGVREITRFNYRVSEMDKKKKTFQLSPPCPHPMVFCVWRSSRFYVTM